MSCKSWLLQETLAGYRIVSTDGDSPPVPICVPQSSTPEQIADALWEAFEARGYRGEPVLLALSSPNCLVATFPHMGRSMARNPQAMAFAFEDFLPVAVEEITCDFVIFENEALGVAVTVATLAPLLSALEQRGVHMASITPGALLALQYHTRRSNQPTRQTLLWQDKDTVEFFEVLDGKPHQWRTLPAKPEVLARELEAFRSTSGSSDRNAFVALGLADSMLDIVRQMAGDGAVAAEQLPIESAVLKGAAAVLSGAELPWSELRRGPLGQYDPYRPIRGRLRFMAFATSCFLLALSATAWIRAEKFQAFAGASRQQQESVFRQVFPGRPVPVGIRARLESEYHKLAATKTQSEDVPHIESVTGLLYEVFAALPEEVRYRLLEMRLESGRVHLNGEVRRHGDADRLAAALRHHGFDVVAPRSQQLGEKGVNVTITASRLEDEKKEPEAGH